ncbi:MAG TPA: hypothetical protein VJ787_14275, partial [Thermoleophilia bacterium]|nr:hypothetical protein [Thermoleophilia bacterium]
LLSERREQLDRVAKILIERETLERSEFEALLDGTPEEEVFREKDEKARRGQQEEKPERASRRPKVGAPAPVNPMVNAPQHFAQHKRSSSGTAHH